MSERYGACRRCKGAGGIQDPILFRIDECPQCSGTGFSGLVEDLADRENQLEKTLSPDATELTKRDSHSNR